MRYVFTLILVSLTGCGSGVEGTASVDPEFQSFVARFDFEAKQHGLSVRAQGISIQFGNLNPEQSSSDTFGYCYRGFSGRIIVIDKTNWQSLSNDCKEVLIFHELGHCALNLSHDGNEAMSGEGLIDESIMNAQLPDGGTYSAYREQYLDQLFNGVTPNFL